MLTLLDLDLCELVVYRGLMEGVRDEDAWEEVRIMREDELDINEARDEAEDETGPGVLERLEPVV